MPTYEFYCEKCKKSFSVVLSISEYDKKKYIELLKRAFENIFPFEFPELDILLTKDYKNSSVQKDLSCFVD